MYDLFILYVLVNQGYCVGILWTDRLYCALYQSLHKWRCFKEYYCAEGRERVSNNRIWSITLSSFGVTYIIYRSFLPNQTCLIWHCVHSSWLMMTNIMSKHGRMLLKAVCFLFSHIYAAGWKIYVNCFGDISVLQLLKWFWNDICRMCNVNVCTDFNETVYY